jgi:hypothetical protein
MSIRICLLASVALGTFGGVAIAAEPLAPKKLLLLGQKPDGHPPATHEYLPGQQLLAGMLKNMSGLETVLISADEPWTEGPELINGADGVVIFLSEGAKWTQADPRRAGALAALAQRGGAITALHWGTGTKDAANIEPFLKLLGACHGGPDRRYKVLEAETHLANPRHPIAAGLKDFRVRDEFYYQLKRVQPAGSVEPILEVPIDGKSEMVAWTWQRPDGGRSFGFTGLHFHDNWQLAEYRRLVVQGVLWTLKQPIPSSGVDVAIESR